MKKLFCFAMALLLLLNLAACGKSQHEEEKQGVPAASKEEPVADELVVYSPLPQAILEEAASGFTAKTGIPVKAVRESAAVLLQRLSKEKNAPRADVLFGAGAEAVEQKKELFSLYKTSELEKLDARFTAQDGLYTALTPMPIVLMYNKQQTTKAPAGWGTLTMDAYSGWVALANPKTSGTAYTALYTISKTMSQNAEPSYDSIEKLALNLDGKMLENISDVYTGLAEGKFAAGITLESSVQKYLDAGYTGTVGLVYPQEGTAVAVEVSALVNGAPHKEYAQQFIDYVSGTEFQEKLVKTFRLRTIRTDLSDPEGFTPMNEIRFAAYNVADAVACRNEILKRFETAVARTAATDNGKGT